MQSHDASAAHASGLRQPSVIQRSWNRWVGGFRSRHLRFIYSPQYLVDLGSTPVDVRRAEKVLGYLLTSGYLPPSRLLRPEAASLSDLRLAHSRQYLELLQRPQALREIVGSDIWPDLHRRALLAQRAAVGGTILAARRTLSDDVAAVNLGGGFHHAGHRQGKGFCIFNDVGVAIGRVRSEGFSGPVLVIDLDLHDGNGTREIFANDPTVFTFSIHNQTWDTAPAVASRSIALGADIEDSRYLEVLDEHLEALFEEVRPELVFYLAGTDVADDDRLGNWRLTARGVLERDRKVMHCVGGRQPRVPTVILLAGGYGNNTWRYTARFLAWLLTGRESIEPPATSDLNLARYRHLTQQLVSSREAAENEVDWTFSEADVMGDFSAGAGADLFLGHYSHHAVELTLEWTGILDRLRQMGFPNPFVDLDLDHSGSHTMRVFADSQCRELLIELRLRIDRRSIPGMQLLGLEWLLLQNPRATFTQEMPRLPGQKYPGLGLVSDIMSLLILMCDRLRLDGIVFVPSQYHLALKGRRFLRFLEPENEGWLRALERALHDYSLPEATRLVAEGRVREAGTGEIVEWRPMQMVIPISEALHERVGGGEYEAAAIAATPDFEVFEP